MEEELFQLFVRHFSDETSEEEEKKLKLLLKHDKNIRADYNDFKRSWENSQALKISFDAQKGYELLKHKIRRKSRQKQLWKIAAVFTALLTIGSLFYSDYNRETIILASEGITQVYLPDSSLVVLNKNGSISYRNSRIWNFNRQVSLDGEAYFEVKKQEGKKFKVNTNSLNIQVLGTHFNVKTNMQTCEVALVEGLVRLYNFSNRDEEIIMNPGDFVLYNGYSDELKQKAVNASLYTAWKEKRISFEDFNLEEIAQIITNIFGYEVKFDEDTFDNIHLNGSAPTDDLDILLKALSEVLTKQITVQEDTVIIK